MHAVEGAWGEWDLAEVSHARINHRAVVGLVGGLQHPLRLPRKVGGLVVVVVTASLDQEVSSRLGERDDLRNVKILRYFRWNFWEIGERGSFFECWGF